jgi:malate synthase
LVPIAKAVFDEHMKTPNQLSKLREDVMVTREDMLRVPEGTRTDAGLRQNVRVGVRYLESWLRGNGCVPIENLMEDAATAEISRSQVWQQVRAGLVSPEKLDQVMNEELRHFNTGQFSEAKTLFRALSTAEAFEEFLTVPAYQRLLAQAA